jgi:hypothetical protein
MLFDNASRAFVVAQSDELRMPAMIAFSLPQELDLSREFRPDPNTLKRLAADASPVIPCSEEMPPSISWL